MIYENIKTQISNKKISQIELNDLKNIISDCFLNCNTFMPFLFDSLKTMDYKDVIVHGFWEKQHDLEFQESNMQNANFPIFLKIDTNENIGKLLAYIHAIVFFAKEKGCLLFNVSVYKDLVESRDNRVVFDLLFHQTKLQNDNSPIKWNNQKMTPDNLFYHQQSIHSLSVSFQIGLDGEEFGLSVIKENARFLYYVCGIMARKEPSIQKQIIQSQINFLESEGKTDLPLWERCFDWINF